MVDKHIGTHAPATPSRKTRVLLVASGSFDSVGDSYLRTLSTSAAYEVRLFDPLRPLRGIELLSERQKSLLTSGLSLVSRSIFAEPFALSLSRLTRVADEFAPDIVLVNYMSHIPPRVVASFRNNNRSAKIVGVFNDPLTSFDRGYFFGADYDALFFKDRYIVDKLRAKLGWKHAWYLPQACDPALHHRVALSDDERRTYGCDITLAGSVRYYRAAQLAPLIGKDFKFWCNPEPRWFEHPISQHQQGRVVYGEDKCKAMLAAKIVLNCNHDAEIAGTNKRTFEVAAIGAFQLTDTPALKDVFCPDTEVAYFDSQAEMMERIEYYLDHADVREAMAERAARRALREHTYAHRWTAHMQTLGVAVPADFSVQPRDLGIAAQ